MFIATTARANQPSSVGAACGTQAIPCRSFGACRVADMVVAINMSLLPELGCRSPQTRDAKGWNSQC